MFFSRIIEEVIFKSCPTPLGKKQRAAPTDQMKTRDRVERIINDLFEFGVPIEVLFDVDDLVKAKNIPKVRTCRDVQTKSGSRNIYFLSFRGLKFPGCMEIFEKGLSSKDT